MFERGEKNPNWNGGIAEYPNHALLKKQRLLVLSEANGLCEICGKAARIVHHIDESTDNHTLDNLKALCNTCHRAVHQEDMYGEGIRETLPRGRTSKYRRKYGLTLEEMTQKYGYSINYYKQLEVKGKLKECLFQLCNGLAVSPPTVSPLLKRSNNVN